MNNSFNYKEYTDKVSALLKEGVSTDGSTSEGILNVTKLNQSVINRLDKTLTITEDNISQINNISVPITMLTIVEGWCPDSAQTLPILNKITSINPLIELKIILREENLTLMDQHLTNGGRSIPKVLFIINDEIITTWGPRPLPLMELTARFKADDNYSKSEFSKDTQLWYNQDKGLTIQNEIVTKLLFSVS